MMRSNSYKLSNMGVLIDGEDNVFSDIKAVLNISIQMEETPKKN